jgi:hypothetical protein
MSDSAPDDLFGFEPVPSASNRHDGWTPERQRRFVAALRKSGKVTAAAKAAGMSRKSAYQLLKRAGPDSGFARAWEAAQGERTRLRAADAAAAIDRALHGEEVSYFYGGLERGVRRVYDDRLLIAALRAAGRAPGQARRRK